MADSKITALTSISTSSDPANDPLVIVDVSDTSMAATGTTKKVTLNQLLATSPTATLASATITGDLTVDTSTLKVDSTNDRVGIGTASPATKLHVVAGDVRIDQTGSGLFGINLVRSAGTTADWYNYIPSGSSDVRWYAGADKMTLDTSGNLSPVGNVVMATSGKGIDFSATASGSGTMTSELLNDYEEGTWVPTLTFATPGTLAVTYGVRTGNYTKVGNLVTARFKIEINPANFVKGTASGGLQITGLPFAASGTGTQYVDLAANITDQTSGSLVLSYPQASIIYFEQTQVSGSRIIRSSAAVDASNFAATNTGFISLQVVLTYTV